MGGMVIIGAGETGVAAALALREAGWTGAIDLIGAEHHAPYERPPLSKAVMTGGDDAAFPAIASAARFSDHGIDHHRGAHVTAIDLGGHAVDLEDGRRLSYDRLLIATGARARTLSVPGGELAITLRSLDDAFALRARLGPGRSLVVIGGGFIGLEIAASARTLGTAVTVLEGAPRILGRAVPAELAAIVADRHAAEGVEILTGVRIERLARTPDGVAVHLEDGSVFPADAVVAGIGAAPDTALAAAAGLAIDNGVAVDARLRTSDPDVFAAGDCCSFPHPLYGNRRIRLEAWRNAQEQGAFAARAMLGAEDAYAAVPWFWSDQYDLHLQIAGLTDGSETVVERPVGEGAKLLFHLAPADGRLVAAGGVGPIGKVAKDLRLAEMMIARRLAPDPAALAAPAARLKDLLAA